MKHVPVVLILALALQLTILPVLDARAYHSGEPWEDVHPAAHNAFGETHARTDQPVIDGVKRTWMWGPEPYTDGMLEQYSDSPGGMRLVQYFDKSRMEITYPSGDQSNPWYVTNGLLVVDMIEGRHQIGDDEFDYSPDPADMAVAGDQDGTSITYADIGAYGLRYKPALQVGSVISQTLYEGEVFDDHTFAGNNITAAYRVQVDGIDHTVASVFWDFMNSEGPVYENEMLVNDKLFLNPFYATGYPVTEAYWGTVNVAGYPHSVLWQCFERRCLTYTPGNPEGWEVEAGNVGQHYFRWRYGESGPEMMPITLAFVALGDDGVRGPAFGCNDSLLTAETFIPTPNLVPTPNLIPTPTRIPTPTLIHGAIQKLLVSDPGEYHNIFYGQNLIVEEVTMAERTVHVSLIGDLQLGGFCDVPRVEETIRATAMQFDDQINAVEIKLNGAEWPENQS